MRRSRLQSWVRRSSADLFPLKVGSVMYVPVSVNAKHICSAKCVPVIWCPYVVFRKSALMHLQVPIIQANKEKAYSVKGWRY